MGRKKVSVNNSGIESSGLPRDFMHAVSEYIWNGFDATASRIDIDYVSNTIDSISYFTITDNGTGIDFSNLENTFGNFNDSVKRQTFQKSSSSVRGNKGRGRFSFTGFCGEAVWRTAYKDTDSNKFLQFDITIRKNSKEFYDSGNTEISKTQETGTTVRFNELFHITAYSFESDEFKYFLAQEFGWFLLLNKEKGYTIYINGVPIDYRFLIAETDIEILPINSAESKNTFKITFIRWSEKIGDKFYYYYLNSFQEEIFKDLTSYNNNAMGFFHSVYIESSYFDNFNPGDDEKSINFLENNRNSAVFKTLLQYLIGFVKRKQKEFTYGEAADRLIASYEKDGIIPKFRNNKYDQAKKADLINVVKGLYCIEPRIFQSLNVEQRKISVGLINLLLDTDERECLIDLIGQIVSLSSDERMELSNILKKTTISRVSKTLALIESRFKVIELLRTLVFDLEKFVNERDHIQKAIEENYWLFGEQYHLVSKNEGFQVLLDKYLALIEKLENNDGKKISRKKGIPDFNRRPDVFVCRKHAVPDPADHEYFMEENLIVELKRPSVTIGKDEVRQIEDYFDIIRNEPSFNSQKRYWKFIVVGNRVDQHVVDLYENQKVKSKKFLIKAVNNFEIYAYTWDDIFKTFDLSHRFLIDNLEFDRNAVKAELVEKGIDFYREPGILVKEAIELGKAIA
jgi:hypothetical protein